MKQRKYGKYFRHNMRLYTAIFAVICLAVAGLYLWNVTRHQTQQIQREYQSDANRIAIELDNQLERRCLHRSEPWKIIRHFGWKNAD